jgi:hypothetical protein
MKAIALALATVGIFFQVASAEAQTVKTLSSKISKIQKSVNALSARALVAGPQGASGPQGAQGPQGPQGPAGASAFNSIPSGTVVAGILGENTAGNFFESFVSLPAPAPIAIDSPRVVVKANPILIGTCGGTTCLSANDQANQEFCSGTSTFPDPRPGFVCIYPTDMFASNGITIQSVEGTSVDTDNGSGSRYGFRVFFTSSASGLNFMSAVWAYRAP